MKINWEVTDGYVGKERPQVTEINDEELVEEFDNANEALLYVEDCIHDDFESHISWDYNNFDAVKDELEKLFEKREIK
ncbi:hypothetical protein LCGC14_1839710 [marine sediment metagenome]|uniref:Uncharacterized protein n=1 Tax=marine sediment metagenome TaxID=412755 RepID=A0A0F9IT17_9ZZZZ